MAVTEKSSALERVRKLLRLAGSSNPHEAASAKERAQALIDRYQLSSEEINGDVLEIVDEHGDHYKEELTRIIAIASGCNALTSARGALAFRGKRSNAQLAGSIYRALIEELARCPPPMLPSVAERETYFACFRLGFIAAVASRLLFKQSTPSAGAGMGITKEKAIAPIARKVIGALDELAAEAEHIDQLFTLRMEAYTVGQTAGYRVSLPMIEPSTIALPANEA